jgi:endoglucanase
MGVYLYIRGGDAAVRATLGDDHPSAGGEGHVSRRRTARPGLRRLGYLASGSVAALFAVALVAWTVHGALGGRLRFAVAPPARTSPAPGVIQPVADVPAVTGPDGSPLAGRQFWVGSGGPAAGQVRALQAAGRTAEAAAVQRVAEQPVGAWLTNSHGGFATTAKTIATDARDAGRLPLLVLRYVPIAGGCDQGDPRAADADAYRTWVAALSDALTGRAAVVILEPGAVAEAVDGCLRDDGAATDRYRMLKSAIVALKANRDVRVYLDAGHPRAVSDLGDLADGLRRAGVEKADGFAVNVGGFETTAADVAYGTQLSDELHAAHFVIDTSRNGNGPPPTGTGRESWCNPPGRRIGAAPTTRTGVPRVDAYVWAKAPGESDGACGGGAPPAGQWWPDYALALASG